MSRVILARMPNASPSAPSRANHKFSLGELREISREAHSVADGKVDIYLEQLGRRLHTGVRSNGKPYVSHLGEVARWGEEIAAPKYRRVVRAAGFGHDLHEDVEGVVIIDPAVHGRTGPKSPTEWRRRKLVLNDELLAYGERGAIVSWMLWLGTRSEGGQFEHRSKSGYYRAIFRGYDSGVGSRLREGSTLDPRAIGYILTFGALKVPDSCSNNDPGERYDPRIDREQIKEAREKGEAELRKLVYRMEIAREVVGVNGGITRSDRRIVEALEERFEIKKIRIASIALGELIPGIETRLLVEPGLVRKDASRAGGVRDVFDKSTAINLTSGIYDYDALDRMVTRVYLDGLEVLYRAYGSRNPSSVADLMRQSGENEAVGSYGPFYVSALSRILRATREEALTFMSGLRRFRGTPRYFFRDAYEKGVKRARERSGEARYRWVNSGSYYTMEELYGAN